MLEFNGRNFHNNAIKVDFVSQTVNFTPVPADGFVATFFLLWFSLLFNSALLLIYCMSMVLVIGLTFLNFSMDAVALCLLGIICFPILVASFFSLAFFIPSWRESKFPEFNAWMSLMTSKLLCQGDSKVFKTINSEAIVDNMFFVPVCSNVVFSYEAIKDFSLYLDSIQVLNRFVGDDGDWFIVIKWSEKPVEGYMKISYD